MEHSYAAAILESARLDFEPVFDCTIAGEGPVLSNRYRVDDVAAVTMALTGCAAADLWHHRGGAEQDVSIDVRAAAAATASMMNDRLDGSPIRIDSKPTTAMYQCGDGEWIHLHGGLPHLHEGTLKLLGCSSSPDAIATAVQRWNAHDLEEELASRQLCGAKVRSVTEWREHAQGKIVHAKPVVEIIKIRDSEPRSLPYAARPLEGVRVLEFGRILAAPTCGRTLAEHGADVLAVSSAALPSIFATEMNTGHGKRSCLLDATRTDDLARIRALARTGDIVVDGFRAGSLARRGLGPDDLAQENPHLVYVSINCYGHSGEWRQRGGWEQLAQATSGLAMEQGYLVERPLKMPALSTENSSVVTSPNDYLTGYLGAFGAMVALKRQAAEGGSWLVRLSLCQTAAWLLRSGRNEDPRQAPGLTDVADLRQETSTEFGRLSYIRPAVRMSATPPHWTLPPRSRGADRAEWVPR